MRSAVRDAFVVKLLVEASHKSWHTVRLEEQSGRKWTLTRTVTGSSVEFNVLLVSPPTYRAWCYKSCASCWYEEVSQFLLVVSVTLTDQCDLQGFTSRHLHIQCIYPPGSLYLGSITSNTSLRFFAVSRGCLRPLGGFTQLDFILGEGARRI